MSTNQPYLTRNYLLLALDPLHVGAGGDQIGRVDSVIIREAGTHLPKIPATSLAGVARSYTAMGYPEKFQRAVKNEKGEVVYQSCAGRGTEEREGVCGLCDCPVCVTYGFTETSGRASPSMVQFFDARLAFYPVTSMAGPLWITSPTALQDLANTGLVPQDALNLRVSDNGKRLQTAVRKGKLNLGWLLLDVAEASAPLGPTGADALRKQGVPNEVLSHLALVPDTLFSHLVNSNLEVRTSTAINPLTGATLRGALFTYEAIPRGTLLWFSAVYKNPKDFLLDGQPLTQDLAWVKDNVEKGLRYIEHLGLGGMVSRGMGRARIVNL